MNATIETIFAQKQCSGQIISQSLGAWLLMKHFVSGRCVQQTADLQIKREILWDTYLFSLCSFLKQKWITGKKKLKFKNLKLRLRWFRVLVQISWNPKYKVGIYLAKSKLHSFFRGGGDFPSVWILRADVSAYRSQTPGITEKKQCNVRDTAKVWSKGNQSQFGTSLNKRKINWTTI